MPRAAAPAIPSPVTALGVVAAMRACVARRLGSDELRGLTACVIGLGHVGGRVAELLAAEGVELTVSDVDPARRPMAPRSARWIDPRKRRAQLLRRARPLRARRGHRSRRGPRAAGGDRLRGGEQRARLQRGRAELAARGILYAPDFIANAGGLISVYGELRGLDHERALELAREIEGTMARILAIAEERAITPLAAAQELARGRLDAAAPVIAGSY